MKKLLLILIVLVAATAFEGKAQEKNLIQFTGVVLANDSLTPVPFASVIIKSSRRGTISDFYGYFSFVAQPSDTVIFSSVGYRKSEFVLPDSLSSNKYSLIKILQKDTVDLTTITVRPLPTWDQFKTAFMNYDVPMDDMTRALHNLDKASMAQRADMIAMDGSMNYKNYMQQQYHQLYYAGQLPPQNIFNPIAWSKFIQAWRDGDYKRDK